LNKPGAGNEPDLAAIADQFLTESREQMRFAAARIAESQNVLLPIEEGTVE
jgi:hypothetical protein